jgi:hypothetical protein
MSFTRAKNSMEKICLKSRHSYYLTTKAISGLKKNILGLEMDPKWTLKFENSCCFLVHPTMHLPLNIVVCDASGMAW